MWLGGGLMIGMGLLDGEMEAGILKLEEDLDNEVEG